MRRRRGSDRKKRGRLSHTPAAETTCVGQCSWGLAPQTPPPVHWTRTRPELLRIMSSGQEQEIVTQKQREGLSYSPPHLRCTLEFAPFSGDKCVDGEPKPGTGSTNHLRTAGARELTCADLCQGGSVLVEAHRAGSQTVAHTPAWPFAGRSKQWWF